MKVERRGDRTVVSDNPFPFWVFYGFFVAAGCAAIVLIFSLAATRGQMVIGLIIGIGNVAGGLVMLRREPASIVEADASVGLLRVRRWGLTGRSVKAHPFHAVDRAVVETSEHTDGGTIYRPALLLKGGASVPVSCFWYQTAHDSEAAARELNGILDGSA